MSDRSASADLKTDATPQVIRPRLFLGDQLLVGPGKIDLLRAVQETGSISGAARATGMGYKRAWVLLDELRRACAADVVVSAAGGSGGGGALLTPLGLALIENYLAIEAACEVASGPHLQRLKKLLAKSRK